MSLQKGAEYAAALASATPAAAQCTSVFLDHIATTLKPSSLAHALSLIHSIHQGDDRVCIIGIEQYDLHSAT